MTLLLGEVDKSTTVDTKVSTAAAAATTAAVTAAASDAATKYLPIPVGGSAGQALVKQADGSYAPANIASLLSPIFTGDPTGPTPATGDNDTSLATTAFVKAQAYVSAAAVLAAQASVVGVNTQTTSYTVVLADAGKVIVANSATALTFTIPTNATVAYPTGTVIGIANTNNGALTIAGASGVNVNSPAGLRLTTQYGQASLLKIGTDTWLLSGNTVT